MNPAAPVTTTFTQAGSSTSAGSRRGRPCASTAAWAVKAVASGPSVPSRWTSYVEAHARAPDDGRSRVRTSSTSS